MAEDVHLLKFAVEDIASESLGEPRNFFDPNVFEVVPLTSEQKGLMGKSSIFLIECSEKVDRYLKENHDYFRLYGIPLMGAAVGITAGAAIGTKIGMVATPFAGVAGPIVGGVTGGIAGGLAGYFFAKAAVNMNVRSSQPFLERCADDGMEIIEMYRDFLEGAEGGKYNDFICPITQDFIEVPVGHPGHQRVYEKIAIERWLKTDEEAHPGSRNDPNHVNSPVREPGRMDSEKLRYDFTYFSRLIKMLSSDTEEIFERNMNLAIEKSMRRLMQSKRETLEHMQSKLVSLFTNKRISKKEFDAALDFLMKEQDLLDSL